VPNFGIRLGNGNDNGKGKGNDGYRKTLHQGRGLHHSFFSPRSIAL
jgi:hypothetical protein